MKQPVTFAVMVAFDPQVKAEHAEIIMRNFADDFADHDLVTHIAVRRVTFEEGKR